MKSMPGHDPDGPHKLPYGQQSRCVVAGHLLDGDACTLILIRDRAKRAWVLYPHGVAGLGVRLPDAEAHKLADHINGDHINGDQP
jgi:hypothetical protein